MAFNMNSSEHSGYQDFEWAIKLNRISLEVIGLWPNPVQSRQQKLLCNLRAFVAFLTIFTCLLVPSIHSLLKVYSDIMLTVDNLIFTLPFITCSIRIAIFWWKKEVIAPIIIMMAEDWLKSKSINERNMMIRWAQISRIVITFAFCTMILGYFFTVILPRFGITTRYLTNKTEPASSLPIQGYYMYDISKRVQYELTFISQMISILFSIVAYMGVDNFLGLLVFHICGQLDILKDRLLHLHESKNYHSSLKSNIMDHKRLLSAIMNIEDTYNIILFTLFLYFVILSAFYGFLMINILEEKDNPSTILRAVRLITIVIVGFGHMFIYCVIGEILMTHCDGIFYAVCNQRWYRLHSKDARDLIPLLIRSSKLPYLTAGRMFTMTIPTFFNLIKTSTGYISVLLTTRN